MSLAKRINQKGKVIILSETTDEPITLAGKLSGICYNADTKNNKKNYERGLDCLRSGHGRTLEFPQVYMVLDGWSARVIREFERHIGGMPTFLQESTRYVNYDNFAYVIPNSIKNNLEAENAYIGAIENISETIKYLEELGIKREDSAMLLPLGMETKVIHRTNLRNLIDMAKVRKCNRAYWEFRELFQSIEDALCIYSDEWNYLIKELKVFKCKCEDYGYCTEKNSCGKMPRKRSD